VLDGASSKVLFYSGIGGETAGNIDTSVVTAGVPRLYINTGTTTSNPNLTSLEMYAGNTANGNGGGATLQVGDTNSIQVFRNDGINLNAFTGGVHVAGTMAGGAAWSTTGTITSDASIRCDNNGTGGGFVDGNYVGQTATTASINTNGRIIRTSTLAMKKNLKHMTYEEAHSVLGLISYTGQFRKDKYDDFADPVRYPFFVAEQGAECGAELWVSRQHGIERDPKTGRVTKFIRNPQGTPVAFRTADITVAHNFLIKELFEEVENLKAEIASLKK